MRLIDADAFADYIQKTISDCNYSRLRIDESSECLTVADVLQAVIDELKGNSLKGFKNCPTIPYCGDAVSREAVLDVINFEDEWLYDAKSHNADTKIAFSAIKSKISELLSITPRMNLAETSQDCISREAVLEVINNPLNIRLDDIIRGLPSVTPQRPKGKWKPLNYKDEMWGYVYKCSNCGYIDYGNDYCPNCGARMESDKE